MSIQEQIHKMVSSLDSMTEARVYVALGDLADMLGRCSEDGCQHLSYHITLFLAKKAEEHGTGGSK